MLSLPLSLLSPAGARGRLSVLIFHRVLPEPDPLFPDVPDVTAFETQLRWIARWFQVRPLATAIDELYAGRLPARALAISFDDGYADNEAVAAPLLRRHGMTATFFVSTGFLAGDCMWNDRVIEALRRCEAPEIDLSALGLGRWPLGSAALRRQAVDAVLKGIKHLDPDRRTAAVDRVVDAAGGRPSPSLMMRPDQVRSLRAQGMDVGAHTVNHPILARLSPAAARQEMVDGKAALEQILGEPVDLFAYPNGVPDKDYTAEHAAMARDCGFRAAVSTAWGAASMRSDRYQLPRFTPWDRTPMRYGVRLLANLGRNEVRAA